MVDDLIYLRVKQSDSTNRTYKVAWTYRGVSKIYHILKADIEAAGTEARTHLDALVDSAMRKGENDEIGAQLTNIADVGSRLYYHLFEGTSGTESAAEVVQNWFETKVKSEDPTSIQVIVDDAIHIPWGLIFHPDIEEARRNSIDFLSYKNFWMTKHSITTTYMQRSLPSASSFMPAEETTLLAAVNDEVRLRLEDARHEWGWSREATCSDEFFKLVQEYCQQSHIIYFYCHANGEQLALRSHPEDVINLSLFKSKMARRNSERPAIVFLNGCATATGHKDRGWIEGTWKHGLQGFIGTETKIPELFAWRYGIDFLHLFLEQQLPVAEALSILRSKHWPLSLLYGAYCIPDLFVKGTIPPTKPPVQYGNLSEMYLGKELLK